MDASASSSSSGEMSSPCNGIAGQDETSVGIPQEVQITDGGGRSAAFTCASNNDCDENGEEEFDVLDALRKHHEKERQAAAAAAAAAAMETAPFPTPPAFLQVASSGLAPEQVHSKKKGGSPDKGKDCACTNKKAGDPEKAQAFAKSQCGDSDAAIATTLEVTRTQTPGAYAMAPGTDEHGQPLLDGVQADTTNRPELQQQDETDQCAYGQANSTSGLSSMSSTGVTSLLSTVMDEPGTNTCQVVATRIEDSTSRSHLQQAEPVDLEAASFYNRHNTNRKEPSFRMTANPSQCVERCQQALGFVALLLIALVVVLLVLLLPSGTNKANEVSNTSLTTNNQTNVLLLDPLATQALDLLPSDEATTNYLAALEDPTSPQSQALQWLLDDPYLPDYLSSASFRIPQRLALATLYFATKGDAWTYNTNWLSYQHHECHWWSEPDFAFFVPNLRFPTYKESNANNPCDNQTNSTYQHIWLWDNNLEGTLPEQVYWLTNLQSISTFRNPLLTGTISTLIGHLRQLQGWTSAQTNLEGSLPTQLGVLSSSLYYFSVFNNDLEGNLPTQLGRLSRLETLILDENRLTGNLPPELFHNKANLVLLLTGSNQLTGPVPSQIGNLAALEWVRFDHNHLTGWIPSQMGRLSSLLDFGVMNNYISGTIPHELANDSNLAVLEVPGNLLSGNVPSELALLESSLTHLLLQNNLLTGSLPQELVGLTNNNITSLKALNLTGNPLLDNAECWIQPSFYESSECPRQHPLASCRCECKC